MSYNEDWSRKKAYLLRNLLCGTTPQHLSTIIEESNSSDSQNYVSSRAYSPLPGLIIEKEPNKHDEPEEHYEKLEMKMKQIYRMMFIEGVNISDYDTIEFNDIVEDNFISRDEVSEVVEDNSTSEESNANLSEHNIVHQGYDMNSAADNDYRTDSTSVEDESQSDSVTTESNNIFENKPNRTTNNSKDPYDFRNDSNYNSESNSTNDYSESSDIVGDDDLTLDMADSIYSADNETFEVTGKSPMYYPALPVIENIGIETNVNFPEHNQVTEKSVSDEEPVYVQITTRAQIHVDGVRNNAEKESLVYDEIIRPPRYVEHNIDNPNVIVEDINNEKQDTERSESEVEFTELEKYIGPATLTSTPHRETVNSVEKMRTPVPVRLTHGSMEYDMLIDHSQSSSISHNNRSEHISSHSLMSIMSQDEFNLINNYPENVIVTDINEILCTILNDNQNINKGTPMSRKRKSYKDISVQTSANEIWDDFRHNIFVGVPKIMRLCSCHGHVCRE